MILEKYKSFLILVIVIILIIFGVNMLNNAKEKEENSSNSNKYQIIGYWQNYVDKENSKPLKLKEVSSLYNVINIAFARASSEKSGEITFELNKYLCETINYSKEEFKSDIKKLQKENKKVFISIGGSDGGEFRITKETEANNFVNSLKKIIDEYGFDGIDIDIETGNIEKSYFEKALFDIYNAYNKNILISINSSLTDMKSADINSGVDNFWYKISADLKDIVWLVSSRYYNSGTQRRI